MSNLRARSRSTYICCNSNRISSSSHCQLSNVGIRRHRRISSVNVIVLRTSKKEREGKEIAVLDCVSRSNHIRQVARLLFRLPNAQVFLADEPFLRFGFPTRFVPVPVRTAHSTVSESRSGPTQTCCVSTRPNRKNTNYN